MNRERLLSDMQHNYVTAHHCCYCGHFNFGRVFGKLGFGMHFQCWIHNWLDGNPLQKEVDRQVREIEAIDPEAKDFTNRVLAILNATQ